MINKRFTDEWLSIEEMSELSSLSVERLKSKIHKGKNPAPFLRKKKIKGIWYFHSSALPYFLEEANLMKSGEYYPNEQALELIGPMYNGGTRRDFLTQWVDKGYMKRLALHTKTCKAAFIKKDWVDNLARSKRYKVDEGASIIGISRKELNSRAELPDYNPYKINIEQFPSGEFYMTEDEIQRAKKIEKRNPLNKEKKSYKLELSIKTGDFASGGIGGRAGRVEKIVDCHEVPDLKMCKECKNDKNLKKKYIIGGEEYCAMKVQKM